MTRLLLALALLFPLSVEAAMGGPHEVVVRFYEAVQGPDEAATVPPLLGNTLRAAIDAQRGYEKACTALARPDEKPHMLDQSPYLYAPDRPTAVKVAASAAGGRAVWVGVDLAADDAHWTDRVLLQKQGPDWKVMEVRWGQGGTLIGRLQAFAAFRCTR